MRRSITVPLLVLVAIGGAVVPARAGSLSGTLEGDAVETATGTPGVYTQNFTGDGDDTTYGAFTVQSMSTVDFSNPPNVTLSNGMITETFTQAPYLGTLFGTGSGSGTANGNGTADVTIDFVITGGTGYFAGDTGEVTITATIMVTGMNSASLTGTYAGSIVPEPGTFTLLAPSMAMGAVVLFRGRRRKARTR